MAYYPTRPLSGQKALITGASSGIGAGIACAFGAAGAAVGVNYRSHPEQAAGIVEEIRDAGGEAVAIRADVSNEADVQAMFGTFTEVFGRIDILVANSGIQQDASFAAMTLDNGVG